MGIMAIGQIIVLSALVAQTLSAPSGCIETCNFLETTVHQTSSGYQDHASLVQGRTHLNNHDYARPGNWTEHNQYNTDGGHGKVHEERGQYEEGAKRVRYYKKNFTATYGTDSVNGVDTAELSKLSDHRYDSIHAPSSQHIDSQSAYGLGQTVLKETGYNRLHSQQTQSMSTRIDNKSERLEDFGEYDRHSQVNQHVPSINTQTIDTQHHVETPDNWRRVNSYKTDGGHGHVFEEEGQYVTGPKKMHYYKKNYTSSYSTGVPQGNIGSTTLDELHSKLQRNLQKDLDSFRRDFHEVSSIGHTAATTHVGSTVGLTQEAVGSHDLQTAESDSYRQHSGYQSVPSTGSMHHYTDQQQRETLTDVRHQLPYTYPTAGADTYGTKKSYQSYETHSSRVLPVSQSSHLPSSYVQVPRDNYQTSYHNAHSRHHLDETQRAEVLGAHQTSVLQNQLLTDSQRVYNPHSSHVTYPNRHSETRQYEEHWRSSSQTGGSVVPERTIVDHSGHHGVAHSERAHYDQNAYSEHRGHHTVQGYGSHANSGSSYVPAYRASSGQLVTGSLDLGHGSHGADCTEETHQQYQQHETRYHRKYKRDDHHGNVQQHQTIDNDNFTQQNQEFGQETQQLEDMTHQNEQFTQQTQFDDFTQQTSGKLEFGQQTVDNHNLDNLMQQSEQFTQQTEGQLEFGQQTVDSQHSDNLMQQNEQLTQQTEGELEFGQQTVDSQHLDDLTQHNEQFTQQTEGQLEFGQQTVNHPRSEDLTQQTQEINLSQQLSDKIKFGQQSVDTEHLDDLTQHSEQFTQQTEGQLEFGQQTVNHPHSENLMQQTQETNLSQQLSDKIEFGQQSVDSEHLDDLTQHNEQFTQQTEGQLEFGQQTVNHPHSENLMQQTQETNLSQQLSDKIEFGQQSVDSEHLDDLTQHSEQFTQQTEGQLEFGQQTVNHQRSEDLTQQTQETNLSQQLSDKIEFGHQPVDSEHLDDLTQHSEQFTQQTEGQLEFGQQTVNHPHSENLMQQTQETNLSQQLNDKIEFGQQSVDSEHLDDLTQHSEQFTQQTEGQLEFGQQTVNHQRSEDLTQQTQEIDFSQQPSGKLKNGQQNIDNQHFEDLMQQSEQFVHQTQGSDDFSQQTNGKIEFGQQTDDTQLLKQFIQRTARSDDPTQQTQLGNKHLDNLAQQSEQISQQTEGQLEFGQQIIGNQHLEHSTQKNEQFAQQTVGSDDFTQQSVGNLEFGQQIQSINKPTKPKSQRIEEFNEQSEDFTQQAGEFNEFTQQTMGHIEFGQLQQPHKSDKPKVDNHHLEDFTQQNEDFTQQVGGFNDFSQQTTGHLEYGQQREQQQNPSWPRHNSQRLEHYSQRNEWDTNNFSQQSDQYPSYNNFNQDFTQQVNQDRSAIGVKSAPKRKPRPRYQKQDVIPSHADRTDTTVDDTFKPVEVNPEADIDNVRDRIIESGSRATYPGSNQHTSKVIFTQGSNAFDNQRQNIDSLHGIHNSNDATVGLQWHYTYHPSDLTNIEGSHDDYYPRHNVGSISQQTENLQQQSKPFDFNFNQRETRDKDTLEDKHQTSQSLRHDKYDQWLGSFQQTETSRFDNPFNKESGQTAKVIPLQRNENLQLTSEQERQSTPTAGETRNEMEPRILQAYGGGPYDASHNDEFYNRIRPNPSATLPPLDGDDPWDIREKPKNVHPAWSTVRNTAEIATTTEAVEITTQTIQTTTQPSFWRRVGHKITSTYDKAKEKAKEIFG